MPSPTIEELRWVVQAIADSDPRGVTPRIESHYCTLCGAIEGAGDLHAAECPWRRAVKLTYPRSTVEFWPIVHPEADRG